VESLLVRKREFINHFDFYNETNFEEEYSIFFQLEKKQAISGTHRVLYHFKNKELFN